MCIVPEGVQMLDDEAIPRCAAMLKDKGDGHFEDHCAEHGGWFPIEVAKSGCRVKLENAEASNPKDKKNILRWIGKKRMSAVNREVRKIFADHAVFSAAFDGEIEILQRILKEKLLGNQSKVAKAFSGEPVAIAAQEGYCDVLNFLLENKADPSVLDDHGVTPAVRAT